MTRPHAKPVALFLAFALVAVACRSGGDDTSSPSKADCPSDYDPAAGVTDTEIRLASSIPQTGPLGVLNFITTGMRSYFNYYNETQGGYKGRKIVFEAKDDGYEPNRTQQNVQELLGSNPPFAFVGMAGTPNNLFVWDEINMQCVPHLFLTTGAAEWGADIKNHPWTMGVLPAYQLEMATFFEYLKKAQPDTKTVAILYQNDDFGESYLRGLERAAEATGMKIVAKESHERGEVIIDTQMNNLVESRADVFVGGITGEVCTNAIRAIGESNWKPVKYINQTCTANVYLDPAGPADAAPQDRYAAGVYSAAYLQNPADPQFAGTPGMKTYLENVKKYAPKGAAVIPTVAIVALGWQLGELFIKTLEGAKELTRPAVMESVRHLDVQGSLLLPGVKFKTNGDKDGYLLEQLSVARYDGKLFKLFPVADYEGRTGEFVDRADLALD